MRWKILYGPHAFRQLRKLDTPVADQITRTLEQRVAMNDDPRTLAKAMEGEWKGLWRFRIGNYRAICEIRDAEMMILVVRVGHRKEIYN